MASNGVTTTDHVGPNESREAALEKIRTAGSITIDSELFEKMYLSPQQPVKGDLRKTLGNPTALGIIGFVMSLTPLSIDLMGWRGSGEYGASDTGVYIFFGGVLLLVSGFLEFILGNTFTFIVFMPFGSFYLAYGSTLQPFYGASKLYGGVTSPGFEASIAYFFLFFGILCFYYLICSIRTNLVFMWIFLTVTIGLCLVSATFWYAAEGDTVTSHRCEIGAGAVLFACCMGGWYLLLALMLPTVDFPIGLPVGDLSHLVPGKSSKAKAEPKNNEA